MIDHIQDLAAKFIDEIEFHRLSTQNEEIQSFHNEVEDKNDTEGEMNNIPGDKSDESEHFNDEKEEKDSLIPNKPSNPIVKKNPITSQSNYIEIIIRKQNMIEGKLEKSYYPIFYVFMFLVLLWAKGQWAGLGSLPSHNNKK